MTWRVKVLKEVQKRVAKLPKPLRKRIQDAINALALGPYGCELDVKPLTGRGEWRLRVGGWRILFRVEEEIVTIVVVGLDPRGDVYK